MTINGWLRDFLWSQSSQVIQSYGSPSAAYGLMFLGAHFVWAFSLMFLFSGRGYWQELIESIIWAHKVVVAAPAIYPRALSIIQGRAVGVAHYLLAAQSWALALRHSTNLQRMLSVHRLRAYVFASHSSESRWLESNPTSQDPWNEFSINRSRPKRNGCPWKSVLVNGVQDLEPQYRRLFKAYESTEPTYTTIQQFHQPCFP